MPGSQKVTFEFPEDADIKRLSSAIELTSIALAGTLQRLASVRKLNLEYARIVIAEPPTESGMAGEAYNYKFTLVFSPHLPLSTNQSAHSVVRLADKLELNIHVARFPEFSLIAASYISGSLEITLYSSEMPELLSASALRNSIIHSVELFFRTLATVEGRTVTEDLNILAASVASLSVI